MFDLFLYFPEFKDYQIPETVSGGRANDNQQSTKISTPKSSNNWPDNESHEVKRAKFFIRDEFLKISQECSRFIQNSAFCTQNNAQF